MAEAGAASVSRYDLRPDVFGPAPGSSTPSIAEILGPFEKELREDEYNAVRVALERGDGDLFRLIRELSAPLDVRERLLKVANLGEGRAA